MAELSVKSPQQLEAAKNRAISLSDETILQSESDQDVNPAIQRAIVQPARMNPRDLLALQRVAGNRATLALLRRTVPLPTRPAIQRVEEEPAFTGETGDIDIQLPEWNEQTERDTGESGEELLQTKRLPQPVPPQIQRGFFSWFKKKGSGNQSQGAVSESKNVTLTGVTAGSVYTSTKSALGAVKGTAETGTLAFLGVFQSLGQTITGWGIPGILGLVKKIYDVVTSGYDMYALEKAKDDLEKKQTANPQAMSQSDSALLEATQHGYSKVRRRFWEGIYKLISQVIKVVAHFITILSGGTAAMVSELVAFGATVLEGVVKVFHKVKGFFKWLLNKRGAHRQQSAERIVDSAVQNDKTALQLLVSLDPMGTLGREKQALKYGYGSPPQPQNIDEMLEFLRTLRSNPKKFGSIDEFKEFVAVKLKST